jgi:saccharopine dehydrogenase-like NADP-dependent oxidoreductase
LEVKGLKVLVVGGTGNIGSAAAWDLVRDESIDRVGIAGRGLGSLERIRGWIGNDKVTLHVLDIFDAEASRNVMNLYDLGVIALPERRSSYRVLEAAIDAGLDAVDVLEEYHRRPDPYETEGLEAPGGMGLEGYGESLHERAQEMGVAILDGMGFAPGLSNITLGEGIRRVSADRAVARVGGIPSKGSAERHPLRYMITWSFGHVLREYMVKVRVLRGGKVVEVDATSDRERFRFDKLGQDEELECAITPGMPSFLYTQQLQEFAEKTIRWPGHWRDIDTLKECGLLDLEPVDFKGKRISPRELFLSLVEPRLRPLPGDEDVCVMWNTAWGPEERADCYMWAKADIVNGISAMARVTGFSAAIGARLLGKGKIQEKGIVPPEEGIVGGIYREFMEELEARKIGILEVIS